MKSTRVLTSMVTTFLYAFLADAVLSVILDTASTAFGASSPALDFLRGTIAGVVILWAMMLFIVIFATPRVRKRIVLPPVLFALWAGFTGAFPVLLLGLSDPMLWLGTSQLVVAVLSLLPLFKNQPVLVDESRPAFSWLNLASGVGVSAVFALLIVFSLVGSAAQAMETSTAGFLRIRPSGLYLEERTFRKDDKEVRLIAMMHIARGDFYEKLAANLRGSTSAVVLLEGVSDEQGLLKKGFSYERVAEAIGVSAQEDSAFTKAAHDALEGEQDENAPILYRRADIDISSFQPATIQVLESLGDILSSHTLKEALEKFQNPSSPLQDDAIMTGAFKEILDLRNTHLLDTVRGALTTRDTVIVPWGALHMPFLSRELIALGFQEVSRKPHRALSFGGG